MSREFKKRALKFAVLPAGEPVFSEQATFVEIVDDAMGEFIEITQGSGEPKIRIDDDEWLIIREVINEAFADIKKNAKASS